MHLGVISITEAEPAMMYHPMWLCYLTLQGGHFGSKLSLGRLGQLSVQTGQHQLLSTLLVLVLQEKESNQLTWADASQGESHDNKVKTSASHLKLH